MLTSDPFCSTCSVLGGDRGGGDRDEIRVWFKGAGDRVSMTLGYVSTVSGGSLLSCNLLVRGVVMGEESLDPERELLLEALLNA